MPIDHFLQENHRILVELLHFYLQPITQMFVSQKYLSSNNEAF